MLAGNGIILLVIALLLPQDAVAQLVVLPAPLEHPSPVSPLDGAAGDLKVASREPSETVSPGNDLPVGGADSSDNDAGERLFREYRRQAGPTGPRQLFSNFKVDPHAQIGVVYDDNILISNGGRKFADVVSTLAAGVTVSAGDFIARADNFLVLNYTATGELFARHGEEDALNHDALLIVRYGPHDLTSQFNSVFRLTHDATADLGQRVSQTTFGESLLLRYSRNDFTSAEGALDFTSHDYAGRSSDIQTSGGLAVDYRYSGNTTIGAGAVFGHLSGGGGLEETFEQAQARLGYLLTNQISLALRVGLEVRERGARAGTVVNPVFSLSGTWSPFGGTIFTVEGHRRVDASTALNGEDYLGTGIQFGLRQTFAQRFYGEFSAGYENADYENVTRPSSTRRTDNYFTLRGAVGYDFVKWLKLEAFCAYRNDRSTKSINTFAVNQFGLQMSVIY